MTIPSPFELGRSIGGNVSRGLREARDTSEIDRILSEAAATGDKTDFDAAMQGILRNVSPINQPQAINLLSQKKNQILAQQEQDALMQLSNEIEQSQPNNKIYQLMANVYRSNLPIEEKHKMIKAMTGSGNLTAEQRQSLDLTRRAKIYDTKIKELQKESEDVRLSPEEQDAKLAEKKRLQDIRDSILGFSDLIKGEEEVIAPEKPAKKEEKKVEVKTPKKELSEEKALEFLNAADGDMELAEKNARKEGYEF